MGGVLEGEKEEVWNENPSQADGQTRAERGEEV